MLRAQSYSRRILVLVVVRDSSRMLHNPAQLIRWRFSIQLSSFVGTLRPMGRKPSAKRLAIGHVVAKTEKLVEANHVLDAGKHVGRR